MSDQYEDETQQGDEDFKNLRAKAKRADVLERENAQMKRELAFTKAGIPMDDPKVGYFVKGYDGDLEAEAIRQAAVEAGFIQPPAPPEPDESAQQAQAGQERVMAAASGTQPEYDHQAGLLAMEEAFKQGGVSAMFDVARQYGVGLETNEV
jgi:ribosomal protein L12E/L44/L45/RPP1/RPP2